MELYQQLQIGSEEDHLVSLFRLSCFTWLSPKQIKRVILLHWLLGQLFSVTGSIEIFSSGNPEMYKRHTPYLILMQSTTMMSLVALLTFDHYQGFSEIIKKSSWSWNLAGDETFRKLSMRSRRSKRIYYAIFCLLTISAILMTPVLGDEMEYQFTVFMWKKYLGHRMYIIFIIFSVTVSITPGIIISSLICIALYCSDHVECQLHLLNALICRLHTKSTCHVNDVRYQKQVDVQLKYCINVHVEILKLFKILLIYANAFLLSLTVLGLSILVSSTYFIVSDFSPRSNFRWYSLIMTASVILWALCESCQRLTDQSQKVFFNACKCPWEQFNNHNRRTLQMLLLNTTTPLKLSCHGVFDANYQLTVKMWRMGYALHTLLTSLD